MTLADIEANISATIYLNGFDAVMAAVRRTMLGNETDYGHFARKAVGTHCDSLTICLLVMKNGFTIVGKSAPTDFDEDLGRRLAYEDAVRQAWPLMGYELKSKMS